MSTELREAIVIGIECLLFSFLLFIIFIFGGYSKDALNIKHTQDLAMTDITEYRNMYQFTEGKEVPKSKIELSIGAFPYTGLTKIKEDEISNLCKVLKGDDIVRFVGLYSKEYNVKIKNGSKSLELYKSSSEKYINSTEEEREKLSNNWAMLNVSDWLGSDIVNEFYCIVVYDELTYQYDSVIFFKKVN